MGEVEKMERGGLALALAFQYSVSRGVFGTPTFYINGFALPDSGSTIDYTGWRSIIDPLIKAKRGKSGDPLHLLL
ncbi:hypothetical protein GH714_006813 [Hevea brasiliensis]|uniref:Thioredoxin-like fold domain-containing protein n=1 Tax=Hevea brasiliensis TaxID=3981 RepID=A0A6A6LD83_HEVBR|nr:hypothetical protein GH714_006813 [Hevea brasiliensis]